jgi:creatinine amidohydrolase
MDYPGTINIHWEHFIQYVLDVTKSLAYHGFKKIILLNGHGSNMPNLDLAARRLNLETDAECVVCAWWNLLTVDKSFLPKWRESYFPGGCAHACELETSAYLYLDEEHVRKDLAKDGRIKMHEDRSEFQWLDLFAAGPATPVSWTSTVLDNGTAGAAHLATKETGRVAVQEAAKQLSRLIVEFGQRPRPERTAHQATPPTMPMPWDQQSSK